MTAVTGSGDGGRKQVRKHEGGRRGGRVACVVDVLVVDEVVEVEVDDVVVVTQVFCAVGRATLNSVAPLFVICPVANATL